MTTATKANPKEWADKLKARFADKHGPNARLKSVLAKIAPDPVDHLVFTARITKAVIDRDGEVLLPEGMIHSEFDKSGAIFWNHNYDLPVAVPIGQLKKGKDDVIAQCKFIESESDAAMPSVADNARAFVKAMHEAGRSVGVSVGFIPVESRNPTKKDLEMFGRDVKRVFSKWKLLEWSIAPVQANPEAYTIPAEVAKSLGSVRCKALGIEATEQDQPVPAEAVLIDSDLNGARAMLAQRKALRDAERQAKGLLAQRKHAREVARKAMVERRATRLASVPDRAKAKAKGLLYIGQA